MVARRIRPVSGGVGSLRPVGGDDLKKKPGTEIIKDVEEKTEFEFKDYEGMQ